VSTEFAVRLASARDAEAIAALSRTDIEYDLPWRWTPEKIRRTLHDKETNVAVGHVRGKLVAFGIMRYADESAHLSLFAVDSHYRRRGIGTRVLRWLEEIALVAGIEKIRLEARVNNRSGIAFYRAQGYRVVGSVVGMYRHVEDGVCFEKLIANRVCNNDK
jgi:[ribosomal protein S18]-alanine N-acetyltransferase